MVRGGLIAVARIKKVAGNSGLGPGLTMPAAAECIQRVVLIVLLDGHVVEEWWISDASIERYHPDATSL